MRLFALTTKEAHDLAEEINVDIDDDMRSYYATNEDMTEIWIFETAKERNNFVKNGGMGK